MFNFRNRGVTNRVLALGRQRASTLQAPFLVLQIGALALECLLHLTVAGVEFLLRLLELGLLLGDLLLEHHLHLRLHLCELGFVQRAFFCKLSRGAVEGVVRLHNDIEQQTKRRKIRT